MKVILDHLTKKFPSRNKKDKTEVIAVNDMSIEIPDGKLVGLLGPSGCGKSTALNLICGLETPTSGRVLFGDDDVTALPPEKRGVGLVFQNYALYPHLTVRQNILFPLQNLRGADKLSKEEMEKRMLAAASLVQIDGLLERKPSEMSGGQQQRVAIARALVKTPRVLLLDEPLSNLDARLRLQTREEIRRIQRETGVTTVFVTHDQEEAMSISDVIVVMKDGLLQQTGEPQEVYNDPANLFVARFLGTPPINVSVPGRGRDHGGRRRGRPACHRGHPARGLPRPGRRTDGLRAPGGGGHGPRHHHRLHPPHAPGQLHPLHHQRRVCRGRLRRHGALLPQGIQGPPLRPGQRRAHPRPKPEGAVRVCP